MIAVLNNPAVKDMVLISRTFALDKFGNTGNPETGISPCTINWQALPLQMSCSCFRHTLLKTYSITSLLIHSDYSPTVHHWKVQRRKFSNFK